ncbi:hypothetical protein J2S43_007531 [Catenuloplanes nepalensis]|uniref:FtsK domain-containing protein n=1 Tax=Catenuloplanes nepalensis TaxID=587533 RepID=A0ABT9N5P3_9ACTN|nr:hypothetical protein [Catenuloplanes nepalensis]MDP9799019.1 hypothetical protein [Catenuloplanes nepalensis]
MGRRTYSLNVARGAASEMQNNVWAYVVPPVAAVANLILSGVLSLVWGAYAEADTWQTAWRSGLILACAAAIVATTWAVGRARKIELRFASLLMSSGSCVGLFVLTFRGWTRDSVMVYLIVMACASVLLALTKLMRGNGDDARTGLFGELGERVKELQDIGATGRSKAIDGRVVTPITMVAGGDFDTLAKPEVRRSIASALNVPAGGVRMVGDRNSVRTGQMEVSPVDTLENPPAWPGLSAPGGSIADPIRLAVYQTGKPLPLLLPGDPGEGRNAVGVLILLGQSGSGKTEFQLFLAAEARSRRDAEVVYIDARKGKQLPAAFRNSMHLMITDTDEAEEYLAGLIPDVSRRADQMGAHGHEQWTAGCPRCPKFKVVIVDEASKFIIEAEEDLVELAESIRSVGIFMLLGVQRATGDRMPTSVRSTTGGAICMGVKDAAEGARVLSEETIAAGADPGWKNSKPGALYAEIPGTDPDDWSLPARTFKPDRDAVIGELVAYLTSIGEYVTAAGEPEASHDAGAPAVPVPAGEPGEVVDDDDDPECPPLPIDPECEPDPDPRTPLTVPNRRRIDLSIEPETDQRFSPSQIREIMRQAIVQHRDAGVRQIKPSSFAQVVEVVGEEGLRPPTITKILGEFCEPARGPLLRRAADRGVYVILDDPAAQPALVGAAT